jgi:hypothetical protein
MGCLGKDAGFDSLATAIIASHTDASAVGQEGHAIDLALGCIGAPEQAFDGFLDGAAFLSRAGNIHRACITSSAIKHRCGRRHVANSHPGTDATFQARLSPCQKPPKWQTFDSTRLPLQLSRMDRQAARSASWVVPQTTLSPARVARRVREELTEWRVGVPAARRALAAMMNVVEIISECEGDVGLLERSCRGSEVVSNRLLVC